jgi:hypothetical protein
MYKYIMKSNTDYRAGTDSAKPHGVVLVRRDIDGVETAYGEFAVIDDDMSECTQQETAGVLESLKMA